MKHERIVNKPVPYLEKDIESLFKMKKFKDIPSKIDAVQPKASSKVKKEINKVTDDKNFASLDKHEKEQGTKSRPLISRSAEFMPAIETTASKRIKEKVTFQQ